MRSRERRQGLSRAALSAAGSAAFPTDPPQRARHSRLRRASFSDPTKVGLSFERHAAVHAFRGVPQGRALGAVLAHTARTRQRWTADATAKVVPAALLTAAAVTCSREQTPSSRIPSATKLGDCLDYSAAGESSSWSGGTQPISVGKYRSASMAWAPSAASRSTVVNVRAAQTHTH